MNSEETIKSIIQEVLDVDTEEITYDSHLINDLGADELQVVDIILKIENFLTIKLECENFDLSFKDLLDLSYVQNEMQHSSTGPHYVTYGEIDKDHIYSKIILSFANKLKVPETELNKNTPIHNLQRDDFIEIICNVYKMYEIDSQKYIPNIALDVDRFLKNQNESWYNCGLVFLKVCQHFETLIIGDYRNLKQIYYDYVEITALIFQSPDFSILHDFLSKTNPSLIGRNVNQEILNRNDLLYNKILTMPEKFLLHNYPIDPRGLFICLISTSIAHYNFTHLEDKASKLLESATEINIKWGTYVKPSILANIKDQTIMSKTTDENKTGCFIATAVYGSPYDKKVIVLKEFRDNFLLKKSLGRAFVNFYYIVSPPIAKQIAKSRYLREITKSILIIPVLKLANYLKRKGN